MNSEKRFFIAVALSFLILVLYPVYLKWVSPPPATTALPPAVTGQVPAANTQTAGFEGKTVAELKGKPAEFSMPEEKLHEFSNRLYDAEFSDVGGTVTKLRLKEWGGDVKGDVFLVNRSGSNEGAFSAGIVGQGIDFQNSKFSLEQLDEARGTVSFVFEETGRWKLRKEYRFDPDKPVIHLLIEATNLGPTETAAPLELISELFVADEHGRDRVQTHSFVRFPDKLASANQDKFIKKPFVSEGSIQWQALTKKYLTVILQPDKAAAFSKSFTAAKDAPSIRNALRFNPEAVPPGGTLRREIFIYAGPQYHKSLKAFGKGFEDMLSYGFFGIFKLWLLTALQWAHKLTGNYGWAILLVTVLVKLLFTPLTHMSFESMKKMQAIQPKIKALQDRYKNDQAKLSQEVMELYKKNKVNPMSGCLPMVLQIPIFIAFYQVLAQTVELKGAPFILWVKDLSLPDRAFLLPFSLPFIGDAINILPLFMIGSMVWQQRLTPQAGPSEQQKMMMFMPIIFGFIFYSLPSGLVLYWFVNNLLSIFHQLFVKGKAIPHHEE